MRPVVEPGTRGSSLSTSRTQSSRAARVSWLVTAKMPRFSCKVRRTAGFDAAKAAQMSAEPSVEPSSISTISPPVSSRSRATLAKPGDHLVLRVDGDVGDICGYQAERH